MTDKSLQLEQAKEPVRRSYVPWVPLIEREPEFNPFRSIVAELTAIKAPTIH